MCQPPLSVKNTGFDWSRLTEIDESEFDEFIYSHEVESEGRLRIEPRCIDVCPNGWKFNGFVQYLQKTFPKYVLPPRIRNDEPAPLQRSKERASPNKYFKSGGVLQEFLLYLFSEGYHDFPMVSHRLFWSDSANQEKKGSDGLFVGTYNDEECIVVGEAKFFNSISTAIEEADDSLKDFHKRGVNRKLSREIDIAHQHLKIEYTDPDRIDEMAARIDRESFEDYRIIHPVFLGYDTRDLKSLPDPNEADDIEFGSDASPIEEQLREKIGSHFDSTDYFQKKEKKAPNLEANVGTAEIIFICFPVNDTQEFKKLVWEGMFDYER